MKLQLHNISVEPSTINSTNSNPLKFGLNKSNLHQLQADTVEISSNSKNNQLAFRGSKNIKIEYNEGATKQLYELFKAKGGIWEKTNCSTIEQLVDIVNNGADVQKYGYIFMDYIDKYTHEYDKLVNALASHGFDFNTTTNWCKETMLQRATEHGLRNTIRALLWGGADPFIGRFKGGAFNDDKDGILKYEYKVFLAEKEAREKATNDLIEELNRDTFDTNSLTKAIRLVQDNADINIQNKNGDALLHKLAQCVNDTETLKTVLNKNPDINIQNNNGDTPLHLAGQNHNKEIIKMLLEKGANPNLKNNNEETFIDLI